MKSIDRYCFVCERIFNHFEKNGYLICSNCGHNILQKRLEQTFIINDVLDVDSVMKKDIFVRYKVNITKKFMRNNLLILDVGSGSGKFLYHVKNLFNEHVGIEVTKECIEFSVVKLKLKVIADVDGLNSKVSVVTMWHSLEHIPEKEIHKILNKIKMLSTEDVIIIISVPNVDSIQYKIFGKKFAYYDIPNHIHQFSVKSLNNLMAKYDFVPYKYFFSFSYSAFGYIQGFLNYFNKYHNYFYYRKKRGTDFKLGSISTFLFDFYNYLLLIVFLIPSILLTFLDRFCLKKGGVINICYQKKRN